MTPVELKALVEGAIFASASPITIEQIQNLFDEEERPGKDAIRSVISDLEEDYKDRGITLSEVSSGFRFQAVPETAKWLSRMWEEKPPKYSRATLETLALMAYRQPITRSEIEDIRGVSVSTNIVKSLMERDWIKVVGHRDVPGKPALYATTKDFLDYFDLKSLEELPPLSEIKNLDEIEVDGVDKAFELGSTNIQDEAAENELEDQLEEDQEVQKGDVSTIADLAAEIVGGRSAEKVDEKDKPVVEAVKEKSILDEVMDFSAIDALNANINTDTPHLVEEVAEAEEESIELDSQVDAAVEELEEAVHRVEEEVGEVEPS